MVRVKSITETRDASCDLVKLNALLASIYVIISNTREGREKMYIPRFQTYMMAKDWKL